MEMVEEEPFDGDILPVDESIQEYELRLIDEKCEANDGEV